MKKNHFKQKGPAGLLALLGVWAALVLSPGLYAQSETILLDHREAIQNKRYGPVLFSHEAHMERFECLDCHHRYENGENVLDEDELEEGAPAAQCTTCHREKGICNLQIVFHGLCLGCHLRLREAGETAAPRMCVDCHSPKKQQ